MLLNSLQLGRPFKRQVDPGPLQTALWMRGGSRRLSDLMFTTHVSGQDGVASKRPGDWWAEKYVIIIIIVVLYEEGKTPLIIFAQSF